MSTILTIAELWQGFDSSAYPLDTNVLSVEHIGNNTISKLYYTGRQLGGQCSRVYGVVVGNTSSRHGIVLVNSLDRPIDIEELCYWADKGYVVMGIDYAGSVVKGKHTIYPSNMSYANYTCDDDRYVGEDATVNKQYEYAINTIRAVEYLLSNGLDKVSIVSYGSGSSVAVMALAIDKRIFNGAILFGTLHQAVQYQEGEALDVDANRQTIEQAIYNNEALRRWELLYGAQSYVYNITVPMYVLATGNSKYSNIDRLSDTYHRLSQDSCIMIQPDGYDYVLDDMLDGVGRWIGGDYPHCDISLTHANDNGKLVITATTSLARDSIELWYCRNGQDNGRHWNRTTLTEQQEGVYSAVVDVYQHNTKLLALVTCHGSVNMSSAIMEVDVTSDYDLSHPVPVLYRGGTAFRFVAYNDNGMWHGLSNNLRQELGYLDIPGVLGCTLATFAGNDGSVLVGDSDAITMDICCEVKQDFKVILVEDSGGDNIRYTATVPLLGDGKWQKVTIERSSFRSNSGQAMPSHVVSSMIIFSAVETFIINNICMI